MNEHTNEQMNKKINRQTNKQTKFQQSFERFNDETNKQTNNAQMNEVMDKSILGIGWAHVLFNKAGFIAMVKSIKPTIADPLLSFIIL